MSVDGEQWFVKTEAGKVYGPASRTTLVSWAEDGRIEPAGFLSQDRLSWMSASQMSELGMIWLVETEPGKVYGPFNRKVVIRLFQDGSLGSQARVYRLYEFPIDQDPPTSGVRVIEKVVEKIVEVPVEKIVEKVVIKQAESPGTAVQRVATMLPQVSDSKSSFPMASSSLFKHLDRRCLAALEAAARNELSKSSGKKFGWTLFGRKK